MACGPHRKSTAAHSSVSRRPGPSKMPQPPQSMTTELAASRPNQVAGYFPGVVDWRGQPSSLSRHFVQAHNLENLDFREPSYGDSENSAAVSGVCRDGVFPGVGDTCYQHSCMLSRASLGWRAGPGSSPSWESCGAPKPSAIPQCWAGGRRRAARRGRKVPGHRARQLEKSAR